MHNTNEVACDSREVCGNRISSDSKKKWRRLNNSLVFLTGDTAHAEILLEAFKKNEPTDQELNAQLMVVNSGIVYTIYNGSLNMYPSYENDAIGSGGEIAIAALDHGVSTLEAVEYAISKNTSCGGDIHVFDVNTLEEKE